MIAEKKDNNIKALYLHMQNARHHWIGNHQICEQIDAFKQFVQHKWALQEANYVQNGDTDKALSA